MEHNVFVFLLSNYTLFSIFTPKRSYFFMIFLLYVNQTDLNIQIVGKLAIK